MDHIGTVLRNARLKKRLTLREVSRMTGLSNPAISQIETRWTKNPSWKAIRLLADAYGVDMRELKS